MSKKSNTTKTHVEALRALLTSKENEIISGAYDDLTFEDYADEIRTEINSMIISLMLGCKATEKKNGEVKISFTSPLPSIADISEVSKMMQHYVNDVETPYILKLADECEDDDDMDIDQSVALLSDMALNRISKVNNKNVQSIIPSLKGVFLTASDVVELGALGKELRKHNNRNLMLIIGGITLAVAGGCGIAYGIHKHNENNDCDDIIDCSDEIDGIDVDNDADDVAPVELES